ncbi:MAG TPA: SpoIIE family protein phosphatase [Acidobacteriaceae bacterium]|jgi:anti-sigma regulatory factor (Ser/Thr protein kinase)|nr:SpoIIE family protein phosphatase [Acidobacteriaceae bacterium]
MEIALTEWVPITDLSSVGEARRRALLVGQRLGFDQTRAGQLALLVTESSRNVLVHGGGGDIVVSAMGGDGHPVARILAMDRGPGIANIAQAMVDGYSTAGTMGSGMGAMKRVATSLEIFTGRTGTILLLELGEAAAEEKPRIAGLAVPHPGERLSGDAWTFHRTDQRVKILLVDGLGHGHDAADAAREAVAAFHRRVELQPGELLGTLHDALKKTRGAVAAIAEIRPEEGVLIYAGVGNISAVVLSGGTSRSLISHNGTLGMVTSRIQEFRAEWPADALLVLHSDGLQSRWDLSSYAGLMSRHPALIGATLLRDFRRTRDDASVVVVKAA